MTLRKPVPRRSGCPLNAALEALGDRWSLLIVRDMVFSGASTYREFLESDEGIATNILAERLRRLEERGIVEKEPDPSDNRRWIYSLSPKGLDLLPVLVELIVWGARYHRTEAPAEVLREMTTDRARFIERLRSAAVRKR
jgi:DNA-binding HxlR family transcriptional regulator